MQDLIKAMKALSDETKRLALDTLNVKAYATRDSVNIQSIIPVNLVTIARTSGCLFSGAYKYLIPFAFSIK